MTQYFAEHPLRTAILAEMHARPFRPMRAPMRLLHLGFMTNADEAQRDRAALAALCAAHGAEAPAAGAKHHLAEIGALRLRWEQHSEFTTYSLASEDLPDTPFEPAEPPFDDMIRQLAQPGPLLVRADLHLVSAQSGIKLEDIFDLTSIAASEVAERCALVATDFKTGDNGAVRILVVDNGMTPIRAGTLVRRVLEIETYRTLSLLGLPEAQRLAPRVSAAEAQLAVIAQEMTGAEELASDHRLLGELTALSAQLEAESTASNYRFGASRAYDEIVSQRLAVLGEAPFGGYSSLQSFLARRVGPAMRTCAILEQRQANLAEKLARAANLLRTRVDVEIERQNRDLLHSMNERTRLQLRLQQTVEGLSVAAISYYIVGLIAYVLKGLKDAGLGPDPALGTALAVPLCVLFVAWAVRRIRRRHRDGEH
jgi:uncharacterized membrane-anchored protein